MGGFKTKAEWWEAVRPFHEAGRRARIDGADIATNPYTIHEKVSRQSWDSGWKREDNSIAEITSKEDLLRLAEQENTDAIRALRACYPHVADRLAELGIDPYELRDYLAGLPEKG